MKIPWDKDYLKICLHVVFTGVVIYIFYLLTANISEIISNTRHVFDWVMSLITPLIAGLIIAYLLDPAADFFQEKYVSYRGKSKLLHKHSKGGVYDYKREKNWNNGDRTFGAMFSYIILLCFVAFVVTLLVNSITSISNLETLIVNLEAYIGNFSDIFDRLQSTLDNYGMLDQFTETITTAINMITDFIAGLTQWFVSLVGKAGGLLVNTFVSLVIGFYLLKEKHSALKKCNDILGTFIPQKRFNRIKLVLSDINAIFSGYIRGQLVDAFIMAVLISIALYLCGLNFSVIIGIIAGISNLIPYFGAFVGFTLAVVVGLLSEEPIRALYAGIAILILQQIDGMFIVPKIVGEKVSLHPAVVLLTITAAATAFGIPGMVLAVPIVAIIKLFLTRYISRRQTIKETEAAEQVDLP